MSWHQEWTALGGRIEGLLEAGRFFIESLSVQRDDPYFTGRRELLPHTKEVFKSICEFRSQYRANIPPVAVSSLDRFIERYPKDIADAGFGHVDEHFGVRTCITALASFRAEFTYCLVNTQVLAKRLTDRAFIHLQRSIVADQAIRSRWVAAYGQGEIACERMGGVHLLQHGIWTFKATGGGECTDLVVGEPLRNLDEAEGAAEALVLTEWKVVRKPGELSAKIAAARKQVLRYSSGILGGFELKQYRYLVMVSKTTLPMPPDEEIGDIRHRHINIAVNPSVPSRR